jgi:hypothetical protein
MIGSSVEFAVLVECQNGFRTAGFNEGEYWEISFFSGGRQAYLWHR